MAGVDNRSGALAHIDDETILARLAAGEHASRIAHELGVHKSAIYHRYADRPDYQLARKHGTEVRIEESENEITTAADQFTLSRARERFRAVAWRAEREFPDRWGARTQITGDLQVTVHVSRGLTLEGEKLNEISEAQESGSCVISQE